ncbi:mechanosensitive ion channel family protein [Sphingomonas sp. RT2P30]|uniref:mechanosensitive ion channel family protein n=1 Tax=Parasphingomonas halimpatiens TaxID=3096162 RepID=UPI002FCBB6D7
MPSAPHPTATPTAIPFTVTDINDQVQHLVDTSYAWLRAEWLQALVALGIGLAIVALLGAGRALGHRLCARDAGGTGWWTVFGRAVTRTSYFFIVMLAIAIVAPLPSPPDSIMHLISGLFTVAAAFQGAIWAREIILGAVEHKTASSDYHNEALGNAVGLIRVLVTFALFAIALVVVLSNLGWNVSGLIAGLGVGGIAIGLAAQGIFADLFAALAIIFDRPFRRGDAITYDKSSGTVESIGLKSTRIRGTSGEERIIANKQLLDKEIINNTQRDYRRIIFTLGIAQWTSLPKLQALPDMMKEEIERAKMKFVRAGFIAFGTSSYDFDVEFDSPSAAFQDAFDARHMIGLAIIRRLADEGIDLAYPTQTGLTAEEAGMDPPQVSRRRRTGKIAAPPSSGDRSAADQEHGA